MGKIFIVLLLFATWPLLAQSSPPYKLSRLFDFAFSESMAYDSNIFQIDDNRRQQTDRGDGEDITWNHSLSMNHSATRSFYSYQLGYRFGYSNFLQNSKQSYPSHNLNLRVATTKTSYRFAISETFSMTSEPIAIEFDPFTENIRNSLGISTGYQLHRYINIGLSANHSLRCNENTGTTSTVNFSANSSFSYPLTGQIFFTASTSHTMIYDLKESSRNERPFSSFSMGLRFQPQRQFDEEIEPLARIRQFSLSVGFSERITEGVPVIFSIGASGNIGKETTWSLTGRRNVDFAIIENPRTTTSISLALSHQLGPKLQPSLGMSYQISEIEGLPTISSLGANTSLSYRLTPWINVRFSYSYSSRFGDENFDFAKHRIQLSTTIPF